MLKTLSAALVAAGLVIAPALVQAPGSSADARVVVVHRHYHHYHRHPVVIHRHVWHRHPVVRHGYVHH